MGNCADSQQDQEVRDPYPYLPNRIYVHVDHPFATGEYYRGSYYCDNGKLKPYYTTLGKRNKCNNHTRSCYKQFIMIREDHQWCLKEYQHGCYEHMGPMYAKGRVDKETLATAKTSISNDVLYLDPKIEDGVNNDRVEVYRAPNWFSWSECSGRKRKPLIFGEGDFFTALFETDVFDTQKRRIGTARTLKCFQVKEIKENELTCQFWGEFEAWHMKYFGTGIPTLSEPEDNAMDNIDRDMMSKMVGLERIKTLNGQPDNGSWKKRCQDVIADKARRREAKRKQKELQARMRIEEKQRRDEKLKNTLKELDQNIQTRFEKPFTLRPIWEGEEPCDHELFAD